MVSVQYPDSYTRDQDTSETDWISEMLTKLRVFAQAHSIHIWFVAHPTKMMRRDDGTVPPPKGYDISGSASWFAKADVLVGGPQGSRVLSRGEKRREERGEREIGEMRETRGERDRGREREREGGDIREEQRQAT